MFICGTQRQWTELVSAYLSDFSLEMSFMSFMVIDGWTDEPANTRYYANAVENSFFGGALPFFHFSDFVFALIFVPNRLLGCSVHRMNDGADQVPTVGFLNVEEEFGRPLR